MGSSGRIFDGFIQGFSKGLGDGITTLAKDQREQESRLGLLAEQEAIGKRAAVYSAGLAETAAVNRDNRALENARTQAKLKDVYYSPEDKRVLNGEEYEKLPEEKKGTYKNKIVIDSEAVSAKQAYDSAKLAADQAKEENRSKAEITRLENQAKALKIQATQADTAAKNAQAQLITSQGMLRIAQQNADANTMRAEKYTPGGAGVDENGQYTAATKTTLGERAMAQAEAEVEREEDGPLWLKNDIPGGRDAKINKRFKEIYAEMVGKEAPTGLLADTSRPTLEKAISAAVGKDPGVMSAHKPANPSETKTAPLAAINKLRSNPSPEMLQFFQQKYGYVPEEFAPKR